MREIFNQELLTKGVSLRPYPVSINQNIGVFS